MKRVLITGSSGYFGSKLVEKLKARGDVEILGVDVVEPRSIEPDRFEACDIRDARIGQLMEDFGPDMVIHLAFILNPLHDERLMHEINIGGTRNVLDAVRRHPPKQLFVASSATAYGAWPDNPVPMNEQWPVRPRREFLYAADKCEMDRIVARFADSHPDIRTAWVRPAIIYGPGVENYLSRAILDVPVTVLIGGYDLPIQFVHEDDVVGATLAILDAGASGPFNVAPPDWLTLSEVGGMLGKRTVPVPFGLARALAWLQWKLRKAEAPPGILWFFRDPWVIAPRRLIDELGYTFRFSSRETLRDLLRHRGLID